MDLMENERMERHFDVGGILDSKLEEALDGRYDSFSGQSFGQEGLYCMYFV